MFTQPSDSARQANVWGRFRRRWAGLKRRAGAGLLVMLVALAAVPQMTWGQDAGTEQVQSLKAEAKITLQVGQSKPVAVQITPASAAKQPLRYESGNTGFFTVDDKGVLTGVHEGTSHLSIIAENGVRATVQVEVTAATPAPAGADAARQGVANEGIVIGNAGGEIEIGRLERIIAHVLPYQVIGANPFTLSSSDPSVIAVMDEAKVIRAVKEGTATITVSTLDGQFTDTVTYTVVPARNWDQAAE